MRILHIENTGGVASLLARGEMALGHQSDVLETWRSYINYDHDFEHYYEGTYCHKLWMMKRTIELAKHYDIIHIHSGMARTRVDYLWMKKLMGKPLVVHYHGSETRLGTGMHYRNIADAKVVATPDLLRWHPDATFIRNPMGTMEAEQPEGAPCIVHLPTVRERKGTAYVLKAINGLRAEGRQFEFSLVENVQHDRALKEIARSNIVVDQVATNVDGAPAGLLGMVSLEGMAMGKVVVNSMDSSAFGRYYPKGYPGVYADETNVKEVLGSLLDDPEEVRRLGEKGRKWISEHLSPEVIARQHVKIYERVLNEGARQQVSSWTRQTCSGSNRGQSI
jgi:glycosyltransferase involved in cell wall biosynthesis